MFHKKILTVTYVVVINNCKKKSAIGSLSGFPSTLWVGSFISSHFPCVQHIHTPAAWQELICYKSHLVTP